MSIPLIMARPRPSAREKRLTKNALEHHGKLRANLGLLVRWKNVNNTIDGGRRGIGGAAWRRSSGQSQRCEEPIRWFQSRISPMSTTSGLREGRREANSRRNGCRHDFALIHQALIVIVKKLDGVLDVIMFLRVSLLILSSISPSVWTCRNPLVRSPGRARGLSHNPLTTSGNQEHRSP